ncbi:lytic transglycosylase domain-containing protein [Pseudomonas qingdaonensis]|uniref:lytic transglycosylase domain-containing protein n=1 Tax=Pseudomonas qingdaonensis TaxID=2056231 RepID=UPI0027405F43|nr:lytic transglycosylase domain-containing protein [Pseudomonas oleovorans]
MQTHKLIASLLMSLCMCIATQASAFSLDGTMWERAAKSSKCKVPPLLLYSIALVESRSGAGKGLVSPHPFALRNAPSGPVFPSTRSEADALLERYIVEDRLTDIGMMQINYRWNGHRVSDVKSLLNPETNIKVAAEILCEAIKVKRGDLELGIGGYHTLNPNREMDARAYARNVLHIWRALQRLERTGG